MTIASGAARRSTSVGWQEGHGADDKPTPNPWQASTSWTHSELEKYNWVELEKSELEKYNWVEIQFDHPRKIRAQLYPAEVQTSMRIKEEQRQ